MSNEPIVQAHVPEENINLIAGINADLFNRGLCPDAPEWDLILERSRYTGRREDDQQPNEDFDPDEEAYLEMMAEMYLS
ncbi:hypothetical protein Q8G71_34630, partial [Klebsiella pneumoniae]